MQQDPQDPLQTQHHPPQVPPHYQPQQQLPYTPLPPYPQQIYAPTPLIRKPKRWPWIIALIVVFFLGISIGHANTTSNSNSTTDTTTSSNTTKNSNTTKSNTINTTNANTTAHHKVGETVQVDDKWNITINGVSTSQGDTIIQPKVGNTFILITATFKNISSQQQAMSSWISFTLRGPDGQNYSQSLFTEQSAPDGSVASGALTKGTVSYEVPMSVKTFTLDYADLGGQIQTWDITK